MRQIEAPTANILPIQEQGVWLSGVSMYKERFQAGIEVPPIDVIALPERPEHLILLHGHHRARAAYELGMPTISARLTETDADIQTEDWSELRWFYRGIDTVSRIYAEYQQYWLPRITERGITGLSDLPVDPLNGALPPGQKRELPKHLRGRQLSFREMV